MAIKEREHCVGQSSWFGEVGKRSAGWEGWRAVEPVGARISGELEGGRTQGWDARFGETGAHLHLCAWHPRLSLAELQGDTAHPWSSQGANLRHRFCLEIAFRALGGKKETHNFFFFPFNLEKGQGHRGLAVLPCRIFPRGSGKAWLGRKSPSKGEQSGQKGRNLKWEGSGM